MRAGCHETFNQTNVTNSVLYDRTYFVVYVWHLRHTWCAIYWVLIKKTEVAETQLNKLANNNLFYRCIANHLIKKAGLTHKTAKTGGITLIQRFGSALNLNVHFHMLLLDGVYTTNRYGKRRFQYVSAPLSDELTSLVHTISHRIARFLERQGILEKRPFGSDLHKHLN